MPRSPSPRPPQPLIQVDPDSTSLDHLLHILDAATTAAGEPSSPALAPPPTRRRRRLDDSPPLATHLDDLAADTLAQRHAARRQRELEWDERDNLDRARRALLSSLTAGDDAVRLSTSDDGSDDRHVELDHLSAAERFFDMATDLFNGDDDDNEDEGDDDDMMDDDGWADAGPVHDFHLVGIDGDMFDVESGDDDAHIGEVWAQPRPAAAARSSSSDFRSMLPGFAGERPLNPPHVAPSDTYSAPVPSPDPVIPYLSRDPSSALSYSSFLQPGATFVGEQTFGTRSRAHVQHAPHVSLDGAAPELAWADPADVALAVHSAAARRESAAALRAGLPPRVSSTAHPEFAPQPSGAGAEASGAASSGAQRNAPPPWRAAASAWEEGSALASSRAGASGGAGASMGAAAEQRATASVSSRTRAETDPLLAILRGHTSPSSRYAPYSSSSSTSTHAPVATHPAVGAASAAARSPSSTSPSTAPAPAASPPPNAAAARARARVAQSVNPAARASRSSWGEVGEELLLRAVAREREREVEEERGAAKGRGGPEAESWSVKVTILSYEPELKSLTGVMRAHGVAIPPATAASSTSTAASPPPPPVGDVTTFFSGTILHPILDGLFCSPSPTGSGGEFCVTRSSEAESWCQLGPFKGLTKRELLEGAKSRTWVEERTRGWVLCRWKERDFVNVTAKESSLSISGFYHVVLDRQTGEIEGLYHDPAATPHQRLVLSPADNERGAFGLGSFAYR
ncbi:hypothetical protein JCM8208_006869 [Rhodotorula glutinis]